ncbi:hypothetical protein JW835_09905 [bacterium]|nr:hypothetical protein [bacterium]
MQGQLVKVVFKGKVLLGYDMEVVKKSLAERFKLSDLAVEQLFSGKPVTIKKNVKRQEAMKYREAFLKAGAICTIEWMDPEYIKNQMKLPSETASRIIICPKCRKKQLLQETCEECGYALQPSIHTNHNLLTLVYDSLRERGVPVWVIIAGICVVVFGLILPMFIPKGAKEIPALHNKMFTYFRQASVSDGFHVYQLNFKNKKNIQYDFERVYKEAASLNAYDPDMDQIHNQTRDPFASSGRVAGKMTIKSLGDGNADISFTDCKRSEEYDMGIFNMFAPDNAVEISDIHVRHLQENGRIQSVLSSDCAYLHLLFRMPESIQKISEKEGYEIQISYQGQQLQGTGEVTLSDYVLVDGQVCAKFVHEIQLSSGENNYEGDYFDIYGTLTSFFGLDNRILYLVRFQQTITKNSYEMYEGIYTWVARSREETITFMKKGLAGKLRAETQEE